MLMKYILLLYFIIRNIKFKKKKARSYIAFHIGLRFMAIPLPLPPRQNENRIQCSWDYMLEPSHLAWKAFEDYRTQFWKKKNSILTSLMVLL